MGRRVNRLSDRAVKAQTRPGYHPDGDGLYLQVSPTGTKSWILRYGRGLNPRTGKPWQREMGLGPLKLISLAEARGRAADARRLLLDGIDPIEARDALRAQERVRKSNSLTFNACAEAYIKAHRTGWRNPKHAEQWEATLETYAGPVFGALPVQDVDTALVLRVLESIWATKPETASRVRGRIEHVLDWAKVRGYRTGENPARWRGHLDKLLPKRGKVRRVKHHPALPYEQIGAFVEKLRAEEGTGARALEFAILTAARTGEVIGATPAEIDLKKALWTIPAERMKAQREHRIPLSPRALEILKAQPEGDYIFAGREKGKALSNMALLETVRRMGRADLTVHGFRSTFKDWAAECTSYPNELTEMALAHTIGSEVEAAYRRGDLFEKRKRLMLDWARYCDTPKRGGKVVPIRAGGKK